MIYNMIFEHAEKYPNKTSLIDLHNSISYSELSIYIKSFAKQIKNFELEDKRKVIVFLPNCYEFVISFFGLPLAHKIPILLDCKYNKEIIEIIKTNEVRLMITNTENKDKIVKILKENEEEELLNILTIINIDEQKELFFSKKYEMDEIQTDGDLDEEALILYSSGSSGKPKGVINTHRTLLEAVKNYISTLKITNEDVFMGVTPFFHSYCLGSCMLAALYNGACIFIQSKFLPRQVIKILSTKNITIFHGVPFMYKLLSEQFNGEKIDSVRMCISAGGRLFKEVADKFYEKTQKHILNEYGSTETGTMAINLSVEKYNKVGKPLNNVYINVEPIEELQNLQYEQVGKLSIKSEGMAIGYLNGAPFDRGWFYTGDIVGIDNEGYIEIIGRDKEMVTISGLKVNLSEIYDVIMKHELVQDALIRRVEDKEFGEAVEAIVVRTNDKLTSKVLADHCRKYMAAYKVPRIIEWSESIKKSGTGKSLYML